MMAKLQPKNQESKLLKSQIDKLSSCQETKNLEPEQMTKQVPKRRIDIAGKSVEFAWKMQKEGYQKETIRGNCGCLRALITRGADLTDSESIKEALAKE
jgi:hypothetical protein